MSGPAVRVGVFLIAIFIPAAVTTGFQPLFLADRGLSAAEVGEILALATMARMMAMPGWGVAADFLGRRLVMAVAAGLASVWAFAWLGAEGYWALLGLTVAFGSCAAALMPLADAVALGLAREGRLEYGPVRAVGSIGFMATVGVAGWVTGSFGSGVLPWLIAVPYAGAAVLAFGLPEVRGVLRAAGGIRLMVHRPLLLAIAASGLIQGGHAAVYSLGSIYWRSRGVSEGVIGLLWATGVLAEITLFFLGRRIGDRIGPGGLTGIAAGAAVVRWSVTASTTSLPFLFGAQALHGATYGMTHLSAMLLLSRTVPAGRAGAAQTLHAAIGTALPVGVLMWVCGQVYDGTGAVFWGMAAMGGLALPVAWMISRLGVR